MSRMSWLARSVRAVLGSGRATPIARTFSLAALGTVVATVVSSISTVVPAAAAPAAGTNANTGRGTVPSASAARTISLNETGHLHLTSKHGFTLNEQGPMSGTVAGTIYVHLTAISTSRVKAEVNIYPSGGSLSCSGMASYRRTGATAIFSGSMTINRGTGRYSRVHGSGLTFSGTIQESNRDAITVHVSGSVSG